MPIVHSLHFFVCVCVSCVCVCVCVCDVCVCVWIVSTVDVVVIDIELLDVLHYPFLPRQDVSRHLQRGTKLTRLTYKTEIKIH